MKCDGKTGKDPSVDSKLLLGERKMIYFPAMTIDNDCKVKSTFLEHIKRSGTRKMNPDYPGDHTNSVERFFLIQKL